MVFELTLIASNAHQSGASPFSNPTPQPTEIYEAIVKPMEESQAKSMDQSSLPMGRLRTAAVTNRRTTEIASSHVSHA